jgi:exodeoxyribonuclease V alpha subunit
MAFDLWAGIERLTQDGHLRRLGGSFARFIGEQGTASPPLMLACVVLSELEGRGHSCLLLDELAADPCALLEWEEAQWSLLASGPWPATAGGWASQLAACDQVWQVGDLDFGQPLVLDADRLYLRRYWRDETTVAQAIRTRADTMRVVDAAQLKHWLDILFAQERQGEVPDWQKLACSVALRAQIAIITGGPGTGKTYTVARLLALLFAVAADPAGQRIALAAPTGKAAARLKQSIDKALNELAGKLGDTLPLKDLTSRMGAARTLHSLLGARPGTRAFAHNKGNPLDVDVLIVDEASMVHLEMMASLLDALPPTALLVLLGDKDQLASVEAGAVMGDLCHDAQAGAYSPATLEHMLAASGQQVPLEFAGNGGALAQQTVMLRRSRRFDGPIGQLALAVNAGDVAGAEQCLRAQDGAVNWIEHAQPANVVQLAREGYQPYLQFMREGPGFDHDDWVRGVLQRFEAFRILCAVRDGELGVSGLNAAIEQALGTAGLIKPGSEWYVGRPVMVTRNDYGSNVFNGDIGLTLADPNRPGALRVYFLEGDAVRSVLATRLRNVETAFAMTVHKSQGSEFRHTVLVLPREKGAIIARELIYTGITRASAVFTLVSAGSGVLAEAIRRPTRRASGLRRQLK